MSYSCIAVSDQKVIDLDFTTTEEILNYLDGTTIIGTRVLLIVSAGCLDIGYYLMEKPPSMIPETIVELIEQLTDKDIDGYVTDNPYNNKESVVKTYNIHDLSDDVTFKMVDMDHDDDEQDIIIGQDKYPDLVMYTDDLSKDLSNYLVAVNGKIKRTHTFGAKTYILDAAEDITVDNHVIMDFNPVGGIMKYQLADLDKTLFVTDKIITISLPTGVYFEHNPLIVLRGRLFKLPKPYIKIVSNNTVFINSDILMKMLPEEYPEYADLSNTEIMDKIVELWLNTDDSFLVLPNKLLYAKEFILSPVTELQYTHKSSEYNIDGICIYSYRDYIVPVRNLPSERGVKNVIQHMLFVPELPGPLDTCETIMSDINYNFKMKKPIHPETQRPCRIIRLTSS